MSRRRSLLAAPLALIALALPAATAFGASAGPGETFLTGWLDLPDGAIAGAAGGLSQNGDPMVASVSADGRYVAFVSRADTLDPAAHPDVVNVFRKDRATGAVVLVSRGDGAGGAAPERESVLPVISDDGMRVAFATAIALDPSDVDQGMPDVYVRDIPSGRTILASRGDTQQTFGSSFARQFDLSGDGRYVAFVAEERLEGTDGNNAADVYRRDLLLADTVLVSGRDGMTQAGDGSSFTPSISDDGAWVAFASNSTNLFVGFVPGPDPQVFVRDVDQLLTRLVSGEYGADTHASNGSAAQPDIAGRPAGGTIAELVVAFTSAATNVAPPGVDPSATASVYVRRQTDNGARLASVASDGTPADLSASGPAVSDDGTRVAFESTASNLGLGGGRRGVYLRDLAAGATHAVSTAASNAVAPAIADGGSLVTWVNRGGLTGDSDRDLAGVYGRGYAGGAIGALELVSRPPGSGPFLSPAFAPDEPVPGQRVISADGRYTVFSSASSRLPSGGNPEQVYRRDMETGALELVSRADGIGGAVGASPSYEASISADGTRVAFTSGARFDPAHAAGTEQVYVRDVAAGTTTLVSRANGAGAAAGDDAFYPQIAPGGRHVIFLSRARNLGVDSADSHVYLRDLAAARTSIVDRASGVSDTGAVGNASVDTSSVSADGRYVAFVSRATNLDPAKAAGATDSVYVRDTVTGTTSLVSRRSGPGGASAAGDSRDPAISADGSVVAFAAMDETIAVEAGPWANWRQIVARTLASGENVLVSRAVGGAVGGGDSLAPSVDGRGAVIAFTSEATNLIPGLAHPQRRGVFVRAIATGALSAPPPFGIINGEQGSGSIAPSISDDGRCLSFLAEGHNAVTGPAGDVRTSYGYTVSGSCPRPVRLPVAAAAKPALSRASLSSKRFRVGKKATARVAASVAATMAARKRVRRAPVGTTIRFTLNVTAKVSFAIERKASGRKVGKSCRKPTARLRRKPKCIRWESAGTLTRAGMTAGAKKVAFSGRIGRKALRPGSYRFRARASSAAGVSRWVVLPFTVVRR